MSNYNCYYSERTYYFSALRFNKKFSNSKLELYSKIAL